LMPITGISTASLISLTFEGSFALIPQAPPCFAALAQAAIIFSPYIGHPRLAGHETLRPPFKSSNIFSDKLILTLLTFFISNNIKYILQVKYIKISTNQPYNKTQS